MNKYLILCIDDEREVLESVLTDLTMFEQQFDIEGCESVAEAQTFLTQQLEAGQALALILCDHMMPDIQGVDFLIELNQQACFQPTKKILLTGQAGLEATIEAVNLGGLDCYIAKPWQAGQLQQHVKHHLTQYIIEQEADMMPYAPVLETQTIADAWQQRRLEIAAQS
ncbi:response regulator [Motilimonas pumila]|uniref:Response regulator n=1 Tax=Motilimonas pumila TaxID=2303987 RepID=A0A418YCS5_9GAMM|nr:response regulator [Motilimonas pumila]RJG42294.1 response regulator [Motilimonas pumila]